MQSWCRLAARFSRRAGVRRRADLAPAPHAEQVSPLGGSPTATVSSRPTFNARAGCIARLTRPGRLSGPDHSVPSVSADRYTVPRPSQRTGTQCPFRLSGPVHSVPSVSVDRYTVPRPSQRTGAQYPDRLSGPDHSGDLSDLVRLYSYRQAFVSSVAKFCTYFGWCAMVRVPTLNVHK